MTSPRIRADVFPAELISNPDAPDPQDRIRSYPVRVIVTADELLAFIDSPNGPTLSFRDGLISYAPPVKGQPVHTATTDQGHAFLFRRSGGCGCGSRVKNAPLRQLLALTEQPRAVSSKDQM